MSWNSQNGYALWNGNQQYATIPQLSNTSNALSTQIYLTSNALQLEINDLSVSTGSASSWSFYKALSTVTLNNNNLIDGNTIISKYLSTFDLQCSTINGVDISIYNSTVIIQNIKMEGGTITTIVTRQEKSAFDQFIDGVNGFATTVSEINRAVGGVLENLFGVLKQVYWGVQTADAIVNLANDTVQLATSAQALSDSRELNSISGGGVPGQTTYVYETFNHTTQLQFSTLGAPTYTVFRTTSEPHPNQTLGMEIFISTIIPAGTKAVRAVGDPMNMPIASTQLLSTTNYIQSFGQWSAILGTDYNLYAST